MLPLLAMGLLTGGGLWGGNKLYQSAMDDRNARLAEMLLPLLGQAAGTPMGPPDPQGGMGGAQGAGLLADPGDPRRQAQFAQGILGSGVPGAGKLGMGVLEQALARATQAREGALGREQQQGQFNVSQERQGSQYQQTEARLAEQFRQQFGLSQSESERAAKQWQATFSAQRDETGQRLQMERDRIALERQRMEGAGEPGTAGGKIPAGYLPTMSATGPTLMPMPGTKPYADAVEGERNLATADQRIGSMLDIFAGKERTTAQGRVVRDGGSGTELYGEQAARLSMIRSQIMSDIGKLQNLGVLNPGDVERLDKTLPDPTSWHGPLTKNSSIVAAYEQLRTEFRNKLGTHREANPWLLPPPPPGTVPVAQQPSKRVDNRGPSTAGPPMATGVTGSW